MAESVDAPDLKSVDHCGRGGSSPPAPIVTDNFLIPGTYRELNRIVSSPKFPWYWANSPGEPGQHTSMLYYDHEFTPTVDGKLKRILGTICDKLGACAVMRIKMNSTPQTETIEHQEWHKDWDVTTPQKTAVIYFTTCDGYTEFANGTIVESVENRCLSFDTPLIHRGTTTTNEERRLVMNINYFEK